jgi:hypothetical protein
MPSSRKVIVVEAPTGQFLGFVDPDADDTTGVVMFCWVSDFYKAINFSGRDEARDIVLRINAAFPGSIMEGTACCEYLVTEGTRYDA